MPLAIRSDNGVPFASTNALFNLSKLSLWWLRQCPSGLTTPLRRLAELIYPFHDREVLVTACERLCLHRKRSNVSTVLAGQKLGIKEVDDGIWLASFMHYDLGYFDLGQKTLQPLDNPFGTRLSPMS